jgi:hypothetical protein
MQRPYSFQIKKMWGSNYNPAFATILAATRKTMPHACHFRFKLAARTQSARSGSLPDTNAQPSYLMQAGRILPGLWLALAIIMPLGILVLPSFNQQKRTNVGLEALQFGLIAL